MRFFSRRREPTLTIFFATDVHGSRVCFRKFLAAPDFYGADIAVLGGDMTGKMVVPIVRHAGGRFRAKMAGQEVEVSEDQVASLEARIADNGFYPYRTDPDELADLQAHPERVDELFSGLIAATLKEWGELAEEKYRGTDRVIYAVPGNDDPYVVNDILTELPRFELVDGEVTTIGGRYEMLATSYSNPTPWNTHRELSEAALEERIDELAGRIGEIDTAIFNIHPPPYNTGIDEGPEIDTDTWKQNTAMGQGLTKPVGSKAVRDALESHQPLLSLHGHIHESRGTARLGRTLCVNPGSDYGDGVLRGCLIQLADGKVKGFQLTSG